MCLECVWTLEIFIPEPVNTEIHEGVYGLDMYRMGPEILIPSNDSHRNTWRGVYGQDMLRMGLGSEIFGPEPFHT